MLVKRTLLIKVYIILVSITSISCYGQKKQSIHEKSGQVINRICDSINSFYIDEIKSKKISKELKVWHLSNFENIKDWKTFVKKVNKQLFKSSNDLHLKLYQNYESEEDDSDYEEESTKIFDSKSKASKEIIKSGNRVIDFALKSGITDARILDGNIGYLALYWIAEDEKDKNVIDDVMMKLKETKALIIDVGVNIGGAPFGVKYYSGFLFENKTHLSSFVRRGMKGPRERWSIKEGIPVETFYNKPIYVLTSRRTFSAAESFVFGLKNNNRITQVGKATAGGGFFGGTYNVSSEPKLDLWISRGMTFNPNNGDSWEAKGIQPDIEVDYSKALEKALSIID